jgi:hypothetical protein
MDMSLLGRLLGKAPPKKTITITRSKLNKLLRRARLVANNRERFAVGATDTDRRLMRNARKRERVMQ